MALHPTVVCFLHSCLFLFLEQIYVEMNVCFVESILEEG